MMRFVLDTDVVIAALRSPRGASAALVLAASDHRVTILVSLPLAMEYEAICFVPEHRKAAGLSRDEVRVFLDALLALAEPVEIHFLWRPQLHDPNDEMVLEAAINGQADALVTFNRKDYGTAPARFGIKMMSPAEALRSIRT